MFDYVCGMIAVFVWRCYQYGWERHGALVYPWKVVRGALCEPLCMGWLKRGSVGPSQLHSPMSTGEDSLAKSLIFGTIKDIAGTPTMREYSGQQTL